MMVVLGVLAIAMAGLWAFAWHLYREHCELSAVMNILLQRLIEARVIEATREFWAPFDGEDD